MAHSSLQNISVDIIVFLYEYGFVWVVNSVGQKIKINSFSFGCRQFFFFQYKKNHILHAIKLAKNHTVFLILSFNPSENHCNI